MSCCAELTVGSEAIDFYVSLDSSGVAPPLKDVKARNDSRNAVLRKDDGTK